MSRDFERVGTRATRQSAAWWGCVVADARASSSSPPPLLTATRYIWRHRSRSRHSADGCIRKCKELWQITITTRVQVRSHWLCSSIRAACGCCFEIIFLIALSSLSSFSRRSQFFDQTARISGVVSAKFFISFNWLSNFSFFSFFFFFGGWRRKSYVSFLGLCSGIWYRYWFPMEISLFQFYFRIYVCFYWEVRTLDCCTGIDFFLKICNGVS